ncbi:MAG: hypothetical protein ACOWWO_11665 [Peptococcaceae bacterium]
MPCPLLKADCPLRLPVPQIPACFPAASDALVLPGGNGIFAVAPTERITHYTLLRKVVCQGASPFGIPGNKTGCIFPQREHAACFVVSSPEMACFLVIRELIKCTADVCRTFY